MTHSLFPWLNQMGHNPKTLSTLKYRCSGVSSHFFQMNILTYYFTTHTPFIEAFHQTHNLLYKPTNENTIRKLKQTQNKSVKIPWIKIHKQIKQNPRTNQMKPQQTRLNINVIKILTLFTLMKPNQMLNQFKKFNFPNNQTE